MATKYTKEHLTMLKKLVGHCTRKSDAEISDQSKLTCPTEILEFNVLKKLSKYDFAAELMSEEDNAEYRELVDQPDDQSYHDFNL